MYMVYDIRQQQIRQWVFARDLLSKAGVTDGTTLRLMEFLHQKGFEQGFVAAQPNRTGDGRFTRK